jgi:hypothetical protein
MIGASVQHTLNFRNLAFQIFYFMATQVYICECNLRIAFQCFQKLPEPHQINIEGRFDHAAIIFSHRLAKSSYPLTKCIRVLSPVEDWRRNARRGRAAPLNFVVSLMHDVTSFEYSAALLSSVVWGDPDPTRYSGTTTAPLEANLCRDGFGITIQARGAMRQNP